MIFENDKKGYCYTPSYRNGGSGRLSDFYG